MVNGRFYSITLMRTWCSSCLWASQVALMLETLPVQEMPGREFEPSVGESPLCISS